MTSNSMSDLVLLEVEIPERDIIVVLTVLGAIYLTLFVLRWLKVLRKRSCPSCSGKLSRKPRNYFDRILVALTLYIMPFRRYKCVHCGWEGLRWSARKYKTKDAY